VLVNISLNLAVIPVFGAKGAAISCLVTQTISCILQIVICHSAGLFEFQKSDILRYSCFILLSVLFIYGIHERIGKMIPGILVSAMVSGIFGILTGILSMKGIKQKVIQYLRDE
jgi:peptidoglycan biosynthesis protein MviN/MurJ (putative lipid II flippase)